MNNVKQLISAEAAENIITNALHTAAEAYRNIASTPNSEGMQLGERMREQFIRQAQEAEALCAQIEEGQTRIGQAEVSADKPRAKPLAKRIGASLARKIFEQRGNHSEAHISEAELAAIIEAACTVIEERK